MRKLNEHARKCLDEFLQYWFPKCKINEEKLVREIEINSRSGWADIDLTLRNFVDGMTKKELDREPAMRYIVFVSDLEEVK